MAVLKQIKFGTGNATPIAQTIVTAASDSVLSVNGTNTGLADDANPSYEVDLRIDNATLVKSNDDKKVLKVGTVPATQVSVATGTGLTATDAQTAFKELKDSINAVGGAAKSYKIVATKPASDNTLAEYKIQEKVGSDGTWSDVNDSATIAVPKDQHLRNVELVNQRPADTEHGETDPVSGQFLKFTYVLTNGSESDVYVNVSAFLTENEFGNGLQASNAGVVSVKIDPTSETFLTVGEGGVKLAGVQNAINTAVSTAVENLDVDDTAKDGEYVSQVSETNGKIAVVRANVSDAVLNGYAKGTNADAILATDSLKVALGKLENQVDKAKAAATTKVVKDNAATHLTLTSSTAADGSTTYTIGESDIASKAALEAEIAARKAVDGQSGDTYAANGSTNYISGAKSLNDADVKLDAALKAEETRAKTAEGEIASKVGLTGDEGARTFTPTTNYGGAGTESAATSVMDNMQKLDTQLKKVTDDLAAVQYKVNGTTLEFFGISLKTV